MRASLAWNKERRLVIEMVKDLPLFGIQGQCHKLPIVISPCSPVNAQQAGLDVREHLLFRYPMQFSKSQDGDQLLGQRTSGMLTWTPRGRALCPGCP
jgi:hypothetical protein